MHRKIPFLPIQSKLLKVFTFSYICIYQGKGAWARVIKPNNYFKRRVIWQFEFNLAFLKVTCFT